MSKMKFYPSVECCEPRALLSAITVLNTNAYSGWANSAVISLADLVTFKDDNNQQLFDNMWNTGNAPYYAVIDWGDGGSTNLLNPKPTVIPRFDSAGIGGFTINWGHAADEEPIGLSSNPEYTIFSVEGGHRYLVPGTYTWTVVVMDANGDSITASGQANIGASQQSQGGNRYLGPMLTDTTTIDWSMI